MPGVETKQALQIEQHRISSTGRQAATRTNQAPLRHSKYQYQQSSSSNLKTVRHRGEDEAPSSRLIQTYKRFFKPSISQLFRLTIFYF